MKRRALSWIFSIFSIFSYDDDDDDVCFSVDQPA